jgi:site-specific recombinase XerD
MQAAEQEHALRARGVAQRTAWATGPASVVERPGRSLERTRRALSVSQACHRGHLPVLGDQRVSPHVLRHAAAMDLLQQGRDCTMARPRIDRDDPDVLGRGP